MRILVFVEYLPPQTNGIATRWSSYITHMRKSGHTVHVIGPEGSPLTTIPLLCMPNFVLNNGGVFGSLTATSLIHILTLLDTIDVLHIVYPANPSVYALIPACQGRGIRIFCSHHCHPSQLSFFGAAEPIINPLLRALYNAPFKHFQATHMAPGIDQQLREYIDSHLILMSTGVDTSLFKSNMQNTVAKMGSRNLVYVGRLSAEKNCALMISMFAAMQSRAAYRDYRLTIVGDGPARPELEAMGVANVCFVGMVSHAETSKFYREAQAFVTFSLTETFGQTCTEALACGTPIIYPQCEIFDQLYQSSFPQTRFQAESLVSFLAAVDFTHNNQQASRRARDYCKSRDWAWATRTLVAMYQGP